MFALSLSRLTGLALATSLLPLCAANAQKVVYSSLHREHTRELTQTLTGPAELTARLNARRSGISVAVASFHRNGTQDLLTGYATSTGGALVLQNGAPEALAPSRAEMPNIVAGGYTVPFRENAAATELPIRPDLLLAGNLRGTGAGDVLTAQRGDPSAYFLAGDGNGGFSTPRQFALRGGVSALGTWHHPNGDLLLVAAVTPLAGGKGASGLQLLTLKGEEIFFIPLQGSATSIESVYLNNAGLQDLVFVAGGQATVLDGDSILSGSPHLETLGGRNAVAVAPGHFAYDKRGFTQLAVLSSDATLKLYARPGIDTADLTPAERLANRKASLTRHDPVPPVRQLNTGWSEIENVPGMGSGNDPHALLLHGRLTAGGMEDLLVLTRGQYIEVAHPIAGDNTLRTTPAYVTIDSTPEPAVAAVPARMNTDSRLGIVTASSGLQTFATLPAARTKYYVNITSDAYHSPTNCTVSNNTTCSLRDALAAANAARQTGGTLSSVDYIYVADSTTLATQNNYIDQQGDYNYHFTIETSVNITGVGTCTARTTFPTSAPASCPIVLDANNKDLVFNINTNSTANTFSPYAVFLSNLQLQNAVNNNNYSGNSSGNYGAIVGGAIYDDVDGPGSLTLNNVYITRSSVAYGYGGFAGGAVAVLNSGTGSTAGSVEIDNSTFASNLANNGSGNGAGGALALSTDINFTANNDAWLSNTATNFGGAITNNGGTLNPSSVMTGNLFNANTGQGTGGGMNFSSAISMTDSAFTGNSLTGSLDGPAGGGGGLWASGPNGSVSILYSTFTGNTIAESSANGAGIFLSGTSASGTVYPQSLTYSRIHGNTGGLANTQGLVNQSNGNTGSGRTVLTATNNWWGCNTDPQTTGTNCDQVHQYTSGGTVTTSPFTTLAISLNSTTPAANSTITATASLGQDNTGSESAFGDYSATQDTAYNGVAASITTTKGDTSTSTGSGTLGSTAQYPYSVLANVAGTGHATATVDGFTVTSSNYTVSAADLYATSTHSGNLKAGDTADTYTLTVENVGNASTSGTVTLTDTLPSGFTATAISGSGWSCTLSSLTCTRSDPLSTSTFSYPPITLTVSVASTDAGSYNNGGAVYGGNELNTSNDNYGDTTIVVGPPTLSEAFSPTTVAPNTTSNVTFTIANPSANNVSLTGVAFSDTLPSGLKITTAATSNCNLATTTGAVNATSLSLTGGNIAAGASCTVTAGVQATAIGSYPNPSGAVTATNSNAGGTATATLTVAVTPTKLVFTSSPATPITAGGNSGNFTVALEDNNGNIATSNNGTQILVQVTSGGYLQTYSANTQNGVGTFGLSSIPLTSAETYTYTATSSGYTNGVATEVVNPGPFAGLAVSGYPNPTSAQLAGSVNVKAADSYGNTVPSFTGTVTLTSSDITATLSPASYTFTASDAGIHAFNVTFNTAGTQSITATSGGNTGSQSNIVVADAVWVLSATGQRTEITEYGSALMSALGGATSSSTFGAIAIDNAGVVWSVTSGTNNLQSSTYTGTVNGYNGGGLSAPVAVAIDGLGYIWLANAASYTASEFSPGGVAISPTAGFSTTAGISTTVTSPVGIAIDISGNVWTVNAFNNTVTRILGAAAPVVSPIAAGVKSNTQGTRP